MLKIDREEVYRYLGYRGIKPAPNIDDEINSCIEAVQEVAEPRFIKKTVPVILGGSGSCDVQLGSMKVKSGNLYKHLEGCEEAVMFAATIGLGVDRLIRRAEIIRMSRATVLQAVGAAAVEALCDAVDADIVSNAKAQGKSARRRFSPGYGDFDLSYQPEFLAILNAAKEIGISLTGGYLMIPSKSVTAVIGISQDMTERHDGSNCAECDAVDCMYRKI